MQAFLQKNIVDSIREITVRDVLIFCIVLLAILTRFIGLGDRVMSHDEVNHVVPSFDLFSGRGYRHDPITHGPLQFHLMGLSYFLFGDNDFTSRLPHALFSIATIVFILLKFPRYLGKTGSLVAGFAFLISPFMLFYGRYARNDTINVFLGVAGIYYLLRYFEDQRNGHLFTFTALTALNFTSKETAYIFSAQLLLFFLILFIRDFFQSKWNDILAKKRFLSLNIAVLLVVIAAAAASVYLFRSSYAFVTSPENTDVLPNLAIANISDVPKIVLPLLRFVWLGLLPLVLAAFLLLCVRRHLKWTILRESRSFSMMVVLGTLVLPLLAPFLVRFAGMDPSAYTDAYVLLTNYIFIVFFFFLAWAFGSLWDKSVWWKTALIFYSIYIVFYTTFFTNNAGLLTGMVGSLGHWLNQQSVQRGGQPVYYYALILIPIYEFLTAFGVLTAFVYGIIKGSFWSTTSIAKKQNIGLNDDGLLEQGGTSVKPAFELAEQDLLPTPSILIFLFITGLIAFTIAGEKMPWLTLHIIFPMLLTTGWVMNAVLNSFGASFVKKDVLFYVGIGAFFINSLILVGKLFGANPPFQGQLQSQLQDTYSFLFFFLIEVGLIYILWFQFKPRENVGKKTIRGLVLIVFLLMSLVTARSAYRAAFKNYDNPKEFLVYAHAADGPKLILEQVEEISRRTTTGLDIKVAYDNHGLYPFWWYFRNYPNKIVYLENPTRTLEEAPLIIAGQDKYAKLEAIVKDNYTAYEYMRLWWPMQDYWNLTLDRVKNALLNKEMRQALFEIWFNRDYKRYANINDNQHLTLETWLPSERLRFYVRNDIAAQMWKYNSLASIKYEVDADPYEENLQLRLPDGSIGRSGNAPGDLSAPRGITIAPDGTIFVADSLNHRIQQFSKDGILLNVWGTFASVLEGDAPGGTFNEPWDVAVSEDGYVYVADTFNHRIQKFDATGRFIQMWGIFAQGQSPDSFWGPRGIAIDQNGNVLITDTGNKRVVVFDEDLNYITQVGGAGFEPGQFDEPVGIDVNSEGQVIVADTWNRRVQTFNYDGDAESYIPVNTFDISGWYGQGIDNKPYLTTDSENNILISDPEAGQLLIFDQAGNFLKGFEGLIDDEEIISNPYGLAVDAEGKLWFADAAADIISFIESP